MAQIPASAQSSFEKAMKLRQQRQNEAACKEMQRAISAYPAYVEAYSILGEWYFTERKYADAVKVFQQASNGTRNGVQAFAKPLAKSLLYNYQATEALQVLASTQAGKAADEWKQLTEQAMFMMKSMNQPFNDTIRNMGISLNTRFAETHPYISADSQTLFFTRKVNGIDEDFFRSRKDSCGGWFYARNMGSPPNTSSHESAQMISADGHYLFFSRCDNRSDNGWDRGGCDLYMAYTADSVWSVPQSFGATINTPAFEGMPCLSSDNRELYFVSDRPEGYGGLDIWVSRFDDGLWQEPRNLGPGINTKGDETAPFLHADNNTLYFASNGQVGMGGEDLYFCRRTGDSSWSKVENLGYPINTTANESGISLTVDGRRAYLSSDRDSIAGNYDIYELTMPATLQPVPIAVLKGYTYDSMTKDRLNYASIYINDANTGEQLYHYTSNRGDGSYMITLPVGHNYTYNADRIGYLDITDTLHLASANAMQAIEYNIPLLPQGYQAPVNDTTLVTIHFPRNIAKVSDADKLALEQLILPYLQQKNMMVLVHGYTDNTGTPMINEQLSYERARLVSDVIMAMGVDSSAISSQGWGEADPIATNDTEEGRTENRRVQVIIRR
jgi:outer membrane protein OmpA-like peptidoglycan-associated protein/Tol biopolymer transport system component